MKKSSKLIVFIAAPLILLSTSFFISCKGKSSAAADNNAEGKLPPQTVIASKVEVSSIAEYIEFGGDIRCSQSVDIYSTVSGKITKKLVKTGDLIKYNDILVEVDASRPGANYSSSPVRSTISGTVIKLNADVGAQVSQSSVLAVVGDTSSLEITLNVPEKYSALLHTGQKAYITVPACGKEQFNTIVKEVCPIVDSSIRSQKIILKITDKDSRLKAGMSCRAHIITNEKENIIVIPSSAIIQSQNQNYVFVAEKDNLQIERAKKVPVTTGIKMDGKVEIISGLTDGDFIITKGFTTLTDGDEIQTSSFSDLSIN